MPPIIGFIIVGIGALIVLGGVNGFRAGKMSKIQFGNAANEEPVTLEGSAAKKQGIVFVIAGIAIVAIGLLLLTNMPSAVTIFLGIAALAGGAYFTIYGYRGMRKRDILFALTITRRGVWGANPVYRRDIGRQYVGSRALSVGLGYILLGISNLLFGLILIFKSEWLGYGVIAFVAGAILYVLSAVVAQVFPSKAA
jgi:hypothetical protein